jgi:hypothetical protein
MSLPTDWKTPEFTDYGHVHEWKNHVSKQVQAMWHSFTDDQKKALARQAQSAADQEEWD